MLHACVQRFDVNVNVNVRERFYWSPVSKFQGAEHSTRPVSKFQGAEAFNACPAGLVPGSHPKHRNGWMTE